jgi:hypothetical protein
MSDVVVDDNNKLRKAEDLTLAEEAIKLKNTQDQWAVIDLLLKAWLKRTPDDVEALRIQLEDHREMLDDKEFGTTRGGADMDRRFTLVFPSDLMVMIRTVYGPEELEFNQKFFREFTKRYPFFKVAEST